MTQEIAGAVIRQFLLFTALLTPLELLLPARPEQRTLRRHLLTDILYFALNPFLIKLGTISLFALLATALGAVVPERLRAALQGQPWWLQLAEILLISELLGYWLHRWSHAARWLWRFHAVHHSAEEMDWLVAHRQHPVEAVWLLGAANLPVIALGFPIEPLFGFILAQKVYTAFLHANVRIDYGRYLGALLASPRFHHFHHDADAGERAGNYASTFPIFDILFGTYRVPSGHRFPARYGVDEPISPGYLGQLLHPFRVARRRQVGHDPRSFPMVKT